MLIQIAQGSQSFLRTGIQQNGILRIFCYTFPCLYIVILKFLQKPFHPVLEKHIHEKTIDIVVFLLVFLKIVYPEGNKTKKIRRPEEAEAQPVEKVF